MAVPLQKVILSVRFDAKSTVGGVVATIVMACD